MKTQLSISRLLRVAIKEDERTPQEIAAAAGINYTILWRFLNGRMGLTMTTMDKLANALNLTLTVKSK